MMSEQYWWHAWGGVMAEGTEFEGCWATVILGPSFVSPENVLTTEPIDDVVRLGLTYLHTWDHEPSDDEKEALTPEEYE
jgi:hypothetical protein